MKNQIAKKEKERKFRLTYQSELEPAKGIITDNTTHLSSSHQWGGTPNHLPYLYGLFLIVEERGHLPARALPNCEEVRHSVVSLLLKSPLSPFVFMFRLTSCASSLSLTINCETAIYVLPKSKYMEKAGERLYKFFHFSLRMNYAFTGLVINWSICWVGFDFWPLFFVSTFCALVWFALKCK